MSNGATARIIEARECGGHLGIEEETGRVVGTTGVYANGRWQYNGRTEDGISQDYVEVHLTAAEMALDSDGQVLWETEVLSGAHMDAKGIGAAYGDVVVSVSIQSDLSDPAFDNQPIARIDLAVQHDLATDDQLLAVVDGGLVGPPAYGAGHLRRTSRRFGAANGRAHRRCQIGARIGCPRA